jgi:ATP-grasp domain
MASEGRCNSHGSPPFRQIAASARRDAVACCNEAACSRLSSDFAPGLLPGDEVTACGQFMWPVAGSVRSDRAAPVPAAHPRYLRSCTPRPGCAPPTARSPTGSAAGPLVVFGPGDHAARLTPLTDTGADALIRSAGAAPRLLGQRGTPPTDLDTVRELLLRVSQFADDLPEVTELDLSPVIARPHGVFALDARIKVAPCPPRHPFFASCADRLGLASKRVGSPSRRTGIPRRHGHG